MMFSKRNAFNPSNGKIVIREGAPESLRHFILQELYDLGVLPSEIRVRLCQILHKSPDRDNWTERPNIETEVENLLYDCHWYKVYDFIESLSEFLTKNKKYSLFEEKINDFFFEQGIGWKLENANIIFRGDDTFDSILEDTETVLANVNLNTSSMEIREAINDLSRRPDPDLTGAVQHAIAGLECVAREFIGDKQSTLGKLIADNKNIFPKPIDIVVTKIYGYASENGRHLKEGEIPPIEEVELLVALSASLSSYLARKFNP
jgi:hypothetical protein